MQPDITICVAWRFTQSTIPGLVNPAKYPALTDFSKHAENLPEFTSSSLG
jgi:hypothetical protein